MGNCQAAELATVVIQHPGNNKVERIYCSVSAHEIMSSNPGHYVAVVVTSPTAKSENGMPLKQLRLLRPDDTLLLGHVYRLISFEDVLKDFASKKCVKLGKLLKDKGGGLQIEKKNPRPKPNSKPESETEHLASSVKVEQEALRNGSSVVTNTSSRGVMRRNYYGGGGGQWKPALQSISEVGT